MKEELITFETAILAKEKGFNPETMYYYHDNSDVLFNGTWDNGPVKYNSDKDYEGTCAASSQSFLQRWLRELHGIHISPVKYITWYCDIEQITPNLAETVHICMTHGDYPTYETALEAALQTALKLIV